MKSLKVIGFLLVLSFILSKKVIFEDEKLITPEIRLKNIEKFNNWFSKHVKENFIKLKVINEETYELGVVAEKNFNKDDLLYTFETNMTISSESIYTGKYAELVKSLEAKYGHDELTYLVIIMIDEYYNPNSYWREYIDVLPKIPNSPIYNYWDRSSTLEPELMGTTILRKIVDYKIAIEKRSRALVRGLFSKHPELFDAEIFNEDNVEWALHLIDSRIQNIGHRSIFAPLLDFFRFSASNNELIKQTENQNVSIKVNFDIKKGEEIMYNPKLSSDHLLMYYGIVLENNEDNDCYSISLTFSERKDDSLASKRSAFFSKYFLYDSNHFDLIEECISLKKPFDRRILFYYYTLMMDEVDLQKEDPKRKDLHEDKIIINFTKDNLLAYEKLSKPLTEDIEKLKQEKNPIIKNFIKYKIIQRDLLKKLIGKYEEQYNFLQKDESL